MSIADDPPQVSPKLRGSGMTSRLTDARLHIHAATELGCEYWQARAINMPLLRSLGWLKGGGVSIHMALLRELKQRRQAGTSLFKIVSAFGGSAAFMPLHGVNKIVRPLLSVSVPANRPVKRHKCRSPCHRTIASKQTDCQSAFHRILWGGIESTRV